MWSYCLVFVACFSFVSNYFVISSFVHHYQVQPISKIIELLRNSEALRWNLLLMVFDVYSSLWYNLYGWWCFAAIDLVAYESYRTYNTDIDNGNLGIVFTTDLPEITTIPKGWEWGSNLATFLLSSSLLQNTVIWLQCCVE
jgi:hypothetical protein